MQSILLIEDDPDIAQLIRVNLEREGYAIRHESNGKKALALTTERDFDCIILDLMLPGMDGLQFCQRFRRENRFTPIIMLTAKSDELDRVLGLEMGADDYLTKPFSVRELMARIKAIHRRMETDLQEGSARKEARIEVQGRDDVADLSRTFNEMADRISAVLEELKRTDEQRREQVANISHDLKTPLSSILGFVETIQLKGEALSKDDREQYLRVIRANAETLTRLVTELSELARLESLSVELNPESFSLEELIQDTTMTFLPFAQKKGVTLVTALSGRQAGSPSSMLILA
jgi:DNA-binding response OmpR family regulator